MNSGKAWIYKRALEGDIQLDYTDGTTPFNAVVDVSGEFPVYTWRIVSSQGEELIIPIPLNVPHQKTDSIVNMGTQNGIRYEYLFGKFRTHTQYYSKQALKCIPSIVVTVLILSMIQRLRKRRK